MKLPTTSSEIGSLEPHIKELAKSLFDIDPKANDVLSPEKLAYILELLGNKPPKLVGDLLKDLARQVVWMCYRTRRRGVTWASFAKSAYVEYTIFWEFRTKIIDLLRGRNVPLFYWTTLHAVAFAAIDNEPTPEFLSWWRGLRRLYDKAYEIHPRKHGTITQQHAAVKRVTSDQLQPLTPLQRKEFANITNR